MRKSVLFMIWIVALCVSFGFVDVLAFLISQIWCNEGASIIGGIVVGVVWSMFFSKVARPHFAQNKHIIGVWYIVSLVLFYIGVNGVVSLLSSLVTGDYHPLFVWWLSSCLVSYWLFQFFPQRPSATKPSAQEPDANQFNVDEYNRLREQKDKLNAQQAEVDTRLKELDVHPDKENILKFPRRF